MLSVRTLLTPTTEEQAKATLYDLASALGLRTTNWVVGSVTRVLFAAAAKLIAENGNLAVELARSGFLDEAEGVWLSRVGELVYGVPRVEATFAAGPVTLTNSGGGIYSYDPGDFIAKNTSTGATYTNVEALVIGAGATVAGVALRAQVLGSDGNAAVGQIDDLVTTANGVAITNTAAFEGLDQEEDSPYRERCYLSLGALSPNGPTGIYEYVARTPDLVGGAVVTRTKVVHPTGNGEITVVLAGPAGPLIPADVTLVQAGFDEHATPEIATVTAVSATELATAYTGTVYVSTAAGMTNSEWIDLIEATLIAWTNRLPIGGVDLAGSGSGSLLWRQRTGVIESILIGTESYVLQAQGSEADVPMGALECATLDPAHVALTIVQVVPS